MTNTLDNVREFHVAFNCPISPIQHIPDGPGRQALIAVQAKLMLCREVLRKVSKDDRRCLRLALIIEETAELANAFIDRNLVAALDALGDMDYVEKGTVLEIGLQDVFYEGCERIHKSNMTKLVDGKPIYDDAGKVKKPSTYTPVDLTDLIDAGW